MAPQGHRKGTTRARSRSADLPPAGSCGVGEEPAARRAECRSLTEPRPLAHCDFAQEMAMTDMRDTGTASTGNRGDASTYLPRQRQAADEPTGWVTWIYFAAVMAILIGIFQAIAGLVAIFDD